MVKEVRLSMDDTEVNRQDGNKNLRPSCPEEGPGPEGGRRPSPTWAHLFFYLGQSCSGLANLGQSSSTVWSVFV